MVVDANPLIVTNPAIHRAGSIRPTKVEPFPSFGFAPAPGQSPRGPTSQLDWTEAPVAGNFRLAWYRDWLLASGRGAGTVPVALTTPF